MIKPCLILIITEKILYAYILCLTFLTHVLADPEASSSCLKFTYPVQWTEIKSNTCTLSVRESSSIKSIDFKAKYIPENSSIPQIVTIGTITRPPFKLIWDISEIPNQLTYGITCFAEAKLSRRKKETIKQEGVFLIHNPVDPPGYEVSYSGGRYNINRKSISLTSSTVPFTAQANISWNEKALLFHIKVDNSHFHSALPEEKLNKLGARIILDPRNKRTAYLSKDILIFMIPVADIPYRISTAPVYHSDGSFEIEETFDSCKSHSTVSPDDFKGYTVTFSVPKKVLGSMMPESLGCNIITTVLDENSAIRELSWVKGNQYTTSSPFAFGRLTLLKKPILANAFIQWVLYFFLGLLLGIIAIPLSKAAQKLNPLVKFENYEQEEQLIKNINTIIDAEVTNKKFSIEDIASKLSITPRKLDILIRRHFDRPFRKHLLFCRIEIVKERLRSSNASEISIANSCGFSSIDEMERTFRSFNGITPYRFREENRIS